MANNHHAHVYNNLEEWLAAVSLDPKSQRWGKRKWKRHVEKHGNVPLVLKCTVCSGKEHKLDIKHGAFNPTRPCKDERDYQKGKVED